QAAGDLSRHIRPPIEFRLANAQQLPFDDGAFDGVISTFGVMFATDQAVAAAELARVCRSGGRLVLATWAPNGAVADPHRHWPGVMLRTSRSCWGRGSS